MNYTLPWLLKNDGFTCCSCGRRHFGGVTDCVIGRDALAQMPALLAKHGGSRPYVLCDTDTYAAAGRRVCALLEEAKLPYTLYIIPQKKPAPDERLVGQAVLHCPADCDSVVAVGGGVINDTAKVLAVARRCPDIYVATAPSMDGYASGTSSMERDGLKVSLPAKVPEAIIGDAAILAAAPARMICAGIGDMAAKYISLAEWCIAALLVDEYHCPTVEAVVQQALEVCMTNAAAAVAGDADAACRIAEGLVISGIAMNYAGISRPASGMEHYISHVTDMRALAFGTPADLHGIQCGVATLITLRGYEWLAQRLPDREKALAFVRGFDKEAWFAELRVLLGHGAEAMIAAEARDGKYDAAKHAARLERILENWPAILKLIRGLPRADELERFFISIGHPISLQQLGIDAAMQRRTFAAAKDIRDKYVLGRLLWDLGLAQEAETALFG